MSTSLRCWLAPAGPADEAMATPDFHRVLLRVDQDALRFNDCACVVGRIYVDLLVKTSPGSKVAVIFGHGPPDRRGAARLLRRKSGGPAAQADDVGLSPVESCAYRRVPSRSSNELIAGLGIVVSTTTYWIGGVA